MFTDEQWARGARSNYRKLSIRLVKPSRLGVGRCHGGLTTKIHQAVDGRGRLLAAIVTGGQRNTRAMLAEILAEIYVPRLGRGGPGLVRPR